MNQIGTGDCFECAWTRSSSTCWLLLKNVVWSMKRCPKLVWQCLALVAVCLVVREPANQTATGSAPAKPPAVTNQAPAQFAVTNGFKQLQARAKQGETGAQTSL